MKECYYCDEMIENNSIKCNYCWEKLEVNKKIKISIKEKQIWKTLIIEWKNKVQWEFKIDIPKNIRVWDIIEDKWIMFEIENIWDSYVWTKYYYNNSYDSFKILFIFSKGRLNRSVFFMYTYSITFIFLILLIFIHKYITISYLNFIFNFLSIIVLIYILINLRIKRLHDFNWSSLLAFLPLPWIVLLLYPWNKWDNKYWPVHKL